MAAPPSSLWLAESFLNSLDVDSGRDDLGSLALFRRWLSAHGRGGPAGPADLAQARELRTALREVVRGHGGGAAADPAGLDRLCARVPLRARYGRDGFTLDQAGAGAVGLFAAVLAEAVRGQVEGTWPRLKLCRDDRCQVVFYDRSRNSSRHWCSMNPCGNRSKARAYRRRHPAA